MFEPPHEIFVFITVTQRQAAKAQTRLSIRTVSPEPQLLAYTKYESSYITNQAKNLASSLTR